MCASELSSAIVQIRVDENGEFLTRKAAEIPVTDPAIVNELLAFFPHVGTGRSSTVAGGWYPGAMVRVYKQDGSELRIFIHPQMNYWHEMQGDWPLHPKFRDFVRRLQ